MDTTKLQTALQDVNKEIKSTQSQLKDVEKLLKLDPGNTELLAQKHQLLATAIKDTKEKLETLKQAAQQANTALAEGKISEEQYNALKLEIVETEATLKKLEEQASKSAVAVQKIAEAGDKLKNAGEKVSSAGEKLLPVTAGVTALGTAAVSTAASFESSMSQVQETMGINSDAVSDLNGKSVNTKDALSNLAKQMAPPQLSLPVNVQMHLTIWHLLGITHDRWQIHCRLYETWLQQVVLILHLVSDMEVGTVIPDEEFVQKICEVYHVNPAYFEGKMDIDEDVSVTDPEEEKKQVGRRVRQVRIDNKM